MTSNDADRPAFGHFSRRGVLGTAGAVFAAPVVADRAAMGAMPLANTRPEQNAPVLDAGSHGVVGDGRVDDTRAVQAFLDLCASMGGRIAHFGGLVVRITGPLKSHGVGIVFDPASYGGRGMPGFVASGEGYTALTVIGSVADFCVTVTGDGGADITETGRIDHDGRRRINGIAFGTDDEPFMMSTVRAVRVNNLAGFGVRHAQCWDSTFLSISVERCGRDDAYAFEVAGDASRSCNETTWVRLHVEQAIGAAIRIDPGTLSCSFVKIHSERAIARGTLATWFLGGSCTYDSVRLTAANPKEAGLSIVSNQADFRILRAEEEIRVTVNASDGVVNFHNPGAVFQPAPNQSGIINIMGGTVSVLGMGGGWNLFGCRAIRIEVGYMPHELRSTLTDCAVGELVPQRGSDQGELILRTSRVEAAITVLPGGGRLRALHLCEGSQLVAKGGTLECTDQTIAVDASSRIVGGIMLQHATLRLAGTITGDLVVKGSVHDARAFDGAVVNGQVTGWGPPTVPGRAGAWSVNLAPELARGVAKGGSQRPVVGWRYVAGTWRVVRMDIEG